MTTAQKLSSKKEQILERWADRVRKYVLVSQHTRKSTLLDHIPLFLDNLVDHLNGIRDEAKKKRPSVNMASRGPDKKNTA